MPRLMILISDPDDNVWWEMPEGELERLMVADTPADLALIARSLQDALRTADAAVERNMSDGDQTDP